MSAGGRKQAQHQQQQLPVNMTSSKSPHKSDSRHWSNRIKETIVASNIEDGNLNIEVKGGSDNGMFCFIGEVRQDKINYHSGKLHADDVIFEIQGQKVAGYTLRDTEAWLAHVSQNGSPVMIKTVKQGLLPKDLRQYLNTRFQKGSVDHDLQQTIRDNLYMRTVPCTTRTPRPGEINGMDYTFLTMEEFMNLEKSGNLLESGIYDGNHYGTPKPSKDAATPLFRRTNSSGNLLPGAHPSSEGKRRRNRSHVEMAPLKSPSPPPLKQPKASEGQDGDLGTLPSNWEMALTEDGHPYFIDHNTETTHWLDPRLQSVQKIAPADCDEDDRLASISLCSSITITHELPYGWEKVEDPHYGTYFIDHVNRRTQYENPVLVAKREKSEVGSDTSGTGSLPRTRRDMDKGSSINGRGSPPAYVGGNRRPFFTKNPDKLKGEFLRTTLVKSMRGFGFTIVGGDDSDEDFLQVKNVVPSGPAYVDGVLKQGDVLVFVNDSCVLGYTHQDVVTLFQSISPGETINLEVCRGYPLPFDPNDPNTEIVTTVAVTLPSTPVANTPTFSKKNFNLRNGVLNSSQRSVKSMPDITSASIDMQTDFLDKINQLDLANQSAPPDVLNSAVSKPEMLEVHIVRGNMGFGFTIADSQYGQKVKQILDKPRCKNLLESDILVEINQTRVKEMTHSQVVQVLKDCPKGDETRLLVQRGGIPTNKLRKSSLKLGSPDSEKPRPPSQGSQVTAPGQYFFSPPNGSVQNITSPTQSAAAIEPGGQGEPPAPPASDEPSSKPTPTPKPSLAVVNTISSTTVTSTGTVSTLEETRADGGSSVKEEEKDADESGKESKNSSISVSERSSDSASTIRAKTPTPETPTPTADNQSNPQDSLHVLQESKSEPISTTTIAGLDEVMVGGTDVKIQPPRTPQLMRDRSIEDPSRNQPLHSQSASNLNISRDYTQPIPHNTSADFGARYPDYPRHDPYLMREDFRNRSFGPPRPSWADVSYRQDYGDSGYYSRRDYDPRADFRDYHPDGGERGLTLPEDNQRFRSRTPGPEMPSRNQGNDMYRSKTPNPQDMRSKTPTSEFVPNWSADYHMPHHPPSISSTSSFKSYQPPPSSSYVPYRQNSDNLHMRNRPQSEMIPPQNYHSSYSSSALNNQKIISSSTSFPPSNQNFPSPQKSNENQYPVGLYPYRNQNNLTAATNQYSGSPQMKKQSTSFENELPSPSNVTRIQRIPSTSSSSDPLSRGQSIDSNKSPTKEPEYWETTVALRKHDNGFGFRIIGGTEEGSQVSVGHIVPGGAADLDGRLKTGDEITYVDGQSVIGCSHHRVVQLMGSAALAGRVTLGIKRRLHSKTDPQYSSQMLSDVFPYDVTVTRRESEGFGFVIISSVTKSGSTIGEFIGRIIEKSPAERCGRLHIGDRILAVNNVDIMRMHHEDIVNLIKDSGYSVTLTIGPPQDDASSTTSASQRSSQGSMINAMAYPAVSESDISSRRSDYSPYHDRYHSNTPRRGHSLESADIPEDEYYLVELHRGSRGFGFSIRGGQEFNCMPLYVLRIAEGGAADLDQRLRVGDQICEINAVNTNNMTHAQAIVLIQNGGSTVRMLVRRTNQPPPQLDSSKTPGTPLREIQKSPGLSMRGDPAKPVALTLVPKSPALRHSTSVPNGPISHSSPNLNRRSTERTSQYGNYAENKPYGSMY